MECYYWQNKYPDVGLDGPENTYLGDKFAKFGNGISHYSREPLGDIHLIKRYITQACFYVVSRENMKLCRHTIKLHPYVSNTSYFSWLDAVVMSSQRSQLDFTVGY